MYRMRIQAIIREHPQIIESKDELEEYYQTVSSAENLNQLGVSPWMIFGGIPVTMFLFGLVLRLGGTTHTLVTLPALIVVWLDLFILFFLLFWGERRLLETLLEIRSVFALSDHEYYRFVGRFLQRLYEPSPFAGQTSHIRVHVGSLVAYCSMFVLLLVLSTQLPEQFIVVDGSGPSLALQLYVVVTVALVSFGLCHSLWSTGCLAWFMGVQAKSKPIHLNALRSIDNLGLRPYGRFILHTALIGFLGLLVTGLGYLVSPHPLLMAVTAFGSILFIGWYVGAQYGLHRSMVEAKKNRIDQLNETYVDITDQWFSAPASETRIELVTEIHSLLGLRREIEELPTWPGKTVEFAQIFTAAFVSHIPFILEFFNLA